MKLRHLIFPLALVCTPTAFAADDGDLGATSTGETEVSVSVGDLLQVSVEGDISLGAHTAGSDSTGSTGLCIYRNGSSAVDLTLTSANENSGVFQMISGTDLLPYTVDLSGSAGDSATDVDSGVANALANANTSSSSCGGSYGHDIDVTVGSAQLDAAPAGTYTDTVEILVEPI